MNVQRWWRNWLLNRILYSKITLRLQAIPKDEVRPVEKLKQAIESEGLDPATYLFCDDATFSIIS